jgi:FkbM family methyltransferase
MEQFSNYIKTWSTLKIKNIFEIGANFGQDADFLMNAFGLRPEKIYVFEAHPEMYKIICKIHKFQAFNNAVFNENKMLTFNIVPLNSKNSGQSSLYTAGWLNTKAITIEAVRMDKFMVDHHIDEIDFLKIDVEGASYEVLEGFGERLRNVNAIHVEAEHTGVYNEKTKFFDDINQLLTYYDFTMVYFQRFSAQSDSFWLKKQYIKE